jgi:UDP-N-acetylmuramoyl-tripeptide--D-alanyl-D-alanine ligase
MRLRLGDVIEVLESSCAAPEQVANGYSIDSRSTRPGDLFFAIRGRRLDGHEFVSQALERGAVAAVVERSFHEHSPAWLAAALIPVRDTTGALQVLAREVRRRWSKKIIAITGSTGKTTTKEMVAALLSTRFAVLKSPGNLNNDYGLPQALLELEASHDVAVVELAMSAAGEIERLARIAEPEIGVVTNVAPVHLQFFKTLDDIARAKGELIENLKVAHGRATAVLNFDDVRVRRFADGFKGRVVTFGCGPGAEFRAHQVEAAPGGGTTFRVAGPSLNAQFHLALPGLHNVENALAAIATASLFGVTADDIGKALSAFKNLPGRSEILTLSGGITVLNDCYNSNPRAMERMLETLAGWTGAKRRIVVAGEMLELGPQSAEWHRSVGGKCAECGADWVIGVQGDARFFLEGAREKGTDPLRLRFFRTAREAGEFCRTILREGDLVMVKGSRGVGLEEVIELLGNSLSETPAGRPRASSERTK